MLDTGQQLDPDAAFGDHAAQSEGSSQHGAAHVGGPLPLLQRGHHAQLGHLLFSWNVAREWHTGEHVTTSATIRSLCSDSVMSRQPEA